MRIGYLVHNLNDPAVERRCQMFERGGAQVALAGFCRDEALSDAIRARKPLELGASADAAMAKRALATMRTALFHGGISRFFADCDVVVARNLEQLAIARSFVGKRPLVYECLDIHRLLVGQGASAKIVQAVENALLPRVDLLLTSSPAFVRNHFAASALDAPVELVENKLLVAEGEIPIARPAQPALPIVIGWFGMLRCSRTFTFLSELVAQSKGRIEVLVAGKPSPAELPDFANRVAAVPGMSFAGPYSYRDLPELYGQCHFAWAIDWFEEGLNSKWLLPNRLYEPLVHGVIPIALAEVEVGRWLSGNGVGMVVADAGEASARLMTMTPDDIRAMQQSVASIDKGKLVASDGDCRLLVERIAGLGKN